jgi:hypothetical protein
MKLREFIDLIDQYDKDLDVVLKYHDGNATVIREVSEVNSFRHFKEIDSTFRCTDSDSKKYSDMKEVLSVCIL